MRNWAVATLALLALIGLIALASQCGAAGNGCVMTL